MTLVKMSLEGQNWGNTCKVFVFIIDKCDHPPTSNSL